MTSWWNDFVQKHSPIRLETKIVRYKKVIETKGVLFEKLHMQSENVINTWTLCKENLPDMRFGHCHTERVERSYGLEGDLGTLKVWNICVKRAKYTFLSFILPTGMGKFSWQQYFSTEPPESQLLEHTFSECLSGRTSYSGEDSLVAMFMKHRMQHSFPWYSMVGQTV